MFHGPCTVDLLGINGDVISEDHTVTVCCYIGRNFEGRDSRNSDVLLTVHLSITATQNVQQFNHT